MEANVTIKEIYWNKGLSNFFFRQQALDTLEELIRRSTLSEVETLSQLNLETEFNELDDVEETLYSESVEYCANEWGIELEDEDEDEDEEEKEEE